MRAGAGALRSRVTLLSPSEGEDDHGQPLTTFVDAAAVSADIRHPSGAETVRADAVVSAVRASIRIRRRSDVTNRWRVRHGAVTYQVLAVLPDERERDFVDLACEVLS